MGRVSLQFRYPTNLPIVLPIVEVLTLFGQGSSLHSSSFYGPQLNFASQRIPYSRIQHIPSEFMYLPCGPYLSSQVLYGSYAKFPRKLWNSSPQYICKLVGHQSQTSQDRTRKK